MKATFRYQPQQQHAIAGYVTKLFILAIDLAFTGGALFIATLISSEFDLGETARLWSWTTLLVLLLLRGVAFVVFKTYLIIVRFVGEKDYKNVFYAVTTSSLAFFLAVKLFPALLPAEKAMSIILIDYFVILLVTENFRILMRLVFDQMRQQSTSRLNTVIFGAGELGAVLERVLRQSVTHNYRVVAFFDDNHRVHKKFLNGIRIFNPRKSFAQVVKKHDVKVAIIGINELPEDRRIEFINNCLAHQIKVLKVPPTQSWLNHSLNIGQLRDINFEDLLNRQPIKLDEEGIAATVEDKVVLVTGCAGSIGSELVRQLLRYRPRLIVGYDQAETPLAEITLALRDEVSTGVFHTVIGDIKDRERLDMVFEKYRPQYVFHAAAYKHVPMMERFPEEAIKANVLGTRNVAGLASDYQVDKFVMISTDKVVNPANVMGASKRIAEIYVQSLNYAAGNRTQFITTRFGNVLGSNGSVIPIFKRQIENRQNVTVTHPDVTRFFMTIPEACQLVLEAGTMGKGGEIFVFDMGEPVRIVELAKKMIQLAGMTPGKEIDIVFTGLRPGEKLWEELLDKQEGIIETHHVKIRKATVRHHDYTEIAEQVEQLIEMALQTEDRRALVKHMKYIVPEFTSQNSTFSNLDRSTDQALRTP